MIPRKQLKALKVILPKKAGSGSLVANIVVMLQTDCGTCFRSPIFLTSNNQTCVKQFM